MATRKKSEAYTPPPDSRATPAIKRKVALIRRAQAAHKKLGHEAEPLLAQIEQVSSVSQLSKANQAVLRKAEKK